MKSARRHQTTSERSANPESAEPPVIPLTYAGQESADTDNRGRKPPWSGVGSRTRLGLAFAIAGASDALSLAFAFAPPVQWTIDLATGGALFIVLGWRWPILPALILEAVPGLAALPIWLLVVSSLAATGTIVSRVEPPPETRRT